MDALRAPASPAQTPDGSPRTAGPKPRDVLRLAQHPGGRLGRGAQPPSEFPSGPEPNGGARTVDAGPGLWDAVQRGIAVHLLSRPTTGFARHHRFVGRLR